MNIRVTENEIRYRITNEELDRLECGQVLTCAVRLPGGKGLLFKAEALEGETEFYFENLAALLQVSRERLLRLKAALPSKEGIHEVLDLGNGETLGVALEVDIKRNKK